ncbi:MAG: hypothetical protein ABIH00_11395 [Armatimonadota bacterium]
MNSKIESFCYPRVNGTTLPITNEQFANLTDFIKEVVRETANKVVQSRYSMSYDAALNQVLASALKKNTPSARFFDKLLKSEKIGGQVINELITAVKMHASGAKNYSTPIRPILELAYKNERTVLEEFVGKIRVGNKIKTFRRFVTKSPGNGVKAVNTSKVFKGMDALKGVKVFPFKKITTRRIEIKVPKMPKVKL